jgi:hypothetical protein
MLVLTRSEVLVPIIVHNHLILSTLFDIMEKNTKIAIGKTIDKRSEMPKSVKAISQ